MRYLDLTLDGAAENLALDEALLEEAEAKTNCEETLRIWEPNEPLVVVGRSSQVECEVRLSACRELGIPVFRRISGGAAIVAGPGCLMYTLILNRLRRIQFSSPTVAHCLLLGKLAAVLNKHLSEVRYCGTSDLALGQRKFSGNSARLRRRYLLYHGTLLYDFPLELVERCLTMPPRMPEYRGGRRHGDFLINLPLDERTLRKVLRTAFAAESIRRRWPRQLVERLVAEKYGRREWNLGR